MNISKALATVENAVKELFSRGETLVTTMYILLNWNILYCGAEFIKSTELDGNLYKICGAHHMATWKNYSYLKLEKYLLQAAIQTNHSNSVSYILTLL